MERLTVRGRKGRAYFDEDGLLIRGANGAFHPKKDMTAHFIHQRFAALDKVIDRLAAYEDTGLTPEEVTVLCEMDKRSSMAKMLRWEEAEKDGRLVLLPCKVGDTIYYNNCYGQTLEKKVRTFFCGHPSHRSEPVDIVMIRTTDCDIDMSKFGKTVFLTREEALEAQKGVATQ